MGCVCRFGYRGVRSVEEIKMLTVDEVQKELNNRGYQVENNGTVITETVTSSFSLSDFLNKNGKLVMIVFLGALFLALYPSSK